MVPTRRYSTCKFDAIFRRCVGSDIYRSEDDGAMTVIWSHRAKSSANKIGSAYNKSKSFVSLVELVNLKMAIDACLGNIQSKIFGRIKNAASTRMTTAAI